MPRKPAVRTCEPVMVKNEDISMVDALCVKMYGEDILLMENRKQLIAARKEAFHKLISAGAKAMEIAVKKEETAGEGKA